MESLWTKFKNTLVLYGLEWFGKYYSVYRGAVTSNEDPKNMGRLLITCPAVYGEESPEIWAFPRGLWSGAGYGLWVIPQPGDPVYVSFENGDPEHPLWEYGWAYEGAAPEGAAPHVFTLRTPAGLLVELNDKKGEARLLNAAGFTVNLTPGGIEVKNKEGISLFEILKKTEQEIALIKVTTPMGPSSVPLNALEFTKLAAELAKLLK